MFICCHISFVLPECSVIVRRRAQITLFFHDEDMVVFCFVFFSLADKENDCQFIYRQIANQAVVLQLGHVSMCKVSILNLAFLY